MRHPCIFVLIAALLAVPAFGADRIEAPPERAYSAFSPDPARQFDFLIGTWRVNLRTQQEDLSLKDSVTAQAHIYSILDGKAILELFDSRPIKGYSLRYFDPIMRQWMLWLDWPGRNQSMISSLQGEFRHGRGEFSSRFTDQDGQEIIERFSFNDITPFSLRWDDLRSVDGGRSWSKNWIMEFTRTAVEPEWPIPDDPVPTFVDGQRCSGEPFRPYEAITGRWEGDGARLEAFRILDGCAVMGFFESGDRKEFLFLTYAARAQRWVTHVLDNQPDTILQRYSSEEKWTDVSIEDGGSLHWQVEMDRLTYQRGTKKVTLTRSR